MPPPCDAGRVNAAGSDDWTAFEREHPWLVRKVRSVEVGTPGPSGLTVPADRFPLLIQLVGSALATPVTLDGVAHELLAWTTTEGERASWLCPAPSTDFADVCDDHRWLLQGFGGIVDRAGEPDSWLLNHNQALTGDEATKDASELELYSWKLDEGGEWPIRLTDWYRITTEANGNATLCHRRTGEVLLFAPDHDFDHVEVLEGCPPYSLYRLPLAPTFTRWIEVVAGQWLAALETTARE